MPQFMLLLTTPRALENVGPEDTDPAFAAAIEAFNADLRDSGAWVDAAGLRPTSEGFRTEYADGRVTVVDGPFTDRDDVLMGYWTIQADDLDAATDWAKKVPFEADPQSDGSQIEVVVTDITDTHVTIDGNHPLAGEKLIFDVELVGKN